MAANDTKVAFQESLKTYFKGVKSEWGKITWPNRQQVFVETGSVILITAIFTLLILGLDKIFIWILHFIPTT